MNGTAEEVPVGWDRLCQVHIYTQQYNKLSQYHLTLLSKTAKLTPEQVLVEKYRYGIIYIFNMMCCYYICSRIKQDIYLVYLVYTWYTWYILFLLFLINFTGILSSQKSCKI